MTSRVDLVLCYASAFSRIGFPHTVIMQKKCVSLPLPATSSEYPATVHVTKYRFEA